jgi:hypothetical protein
MSRLKIKQKAEQNKHGVFCVVAAERFAGKSTIAGTIKGKTLMLQAAVLETGSKSAQSLAAKLGNELRIETFTDLDDLIAWMEDFRTSEYETLYVDGLSAITEMKYLQDDVQRVKKKNAWDAFALVADSSRAFLKFAKSLTDGGKDVFVTLAMDPKRDTNGYLVELNPVTKGKVTTAEVSRLCPVFVTLRTRYTDDGELVREMVTKTDDVYPGRVDTLLDDANPGVLPADLSQLLALVKG